MAIRHGEPGEPGQPGEPGKHGGGHGGRGGRGGRGGHAGEGFAARNPTLIGFLIASAIFAVVVYSLLFHIHDQLVADCQSRNEQFVEVNERAVPLNILLRLEEREWRESREVGHRALVDVSVQRVKLADCKAQFDDPWPFG